MKRWLTERVAPRWIVVGLSLTVMLLTIIHAAQNGWRVWPRQGHLPFVNGALIGIVGVWMLVSYLRYRGNRRSQ